jgi:competence protein ComEC
LAEKPLAAVAIAFAFGILAAAYASLAVCLLLAGALLLTLLIVKSGSARTVLGVVLAAFALGAARYNVSREISPSDVSNFIPRVVAFHGRIVSEPESRSDRVRLLMEVTRAQTDRGWERVSGKIVVTIYEPAAGELRLGYGDLATIQARPYIPFDPTNPGQFSWREYLARQGVYACASVRKAGCVVIAPVGGGNPITKAALAAKRHVIASVERIHPKREASLISGMVLGTYAYLPPDVLRDFTRTGTLHLLAASGYNCFILVFLAAPVLTWIRVLPKYRSLALIFLLIMYLLMVGAKPSLVRATVMTSLYLVGRLLRRVPRTQNLFFAAAIVVLVINPSDLFDVGFQLSFLGVWALISIVPVIESMLRKAGWTGPTFGKKRSLGSRFVTKCSAVVVETAAATLAVSLLVGPVVAYYFNYISLVSLPANIAAGLGVSIVFADGIASAILGPVPIIGHVVGVLGTWVARAMLAVIGALGSPHWSAVSVPSPSLAMMIGYYILLFGLYDYLRSRYAPR